MRVLCFQEGSLVLQYSWINNLVMYYGFNQALRMTLPQNCRTTGLLSLSLWQALVVIFIHDVKYTVAHEIY